MQCLVQQHVPAVSCLSCLWQGAWHRGLCPAKQQWQRGESRAPTARAGTGAAVGRSKQAGWEGGKKKKRKEGKSQEQKDERADGSMAAAPRIPSAAITGDWDISRMQRGLQFSVWAATTGRHITLSEGWLSGFQNLTLSPCCSVRLTSRIRPLPEKFGLCAIFVICFRGEER